MVTNPILRRTRDSIARIERQTRISIAKIEHRLQSKRKAVLRGLASLSLPLLAATIALIDPVPKLGRWYMRMAEGYNGYSMFEKPPIGSYMRVYLFNVTNSEEFISGEDANLKVQEVGPFTYLEYRWNNNMTIDWARKVVRFIPMMNVTFIPEMSIADPKDVKLVLPNFPLLSMSAMLTEYPIWTNMAFNLLTLNLNTKAFKVLNAHEFLWGFHDDLVKMAHTIMPGWVETEQLGILREVYENSGKQLMEMELEQQTRYRLRTVDGEQYLKQWSNDLKSQCNRLKGAYEGMYFSPGFNEETKFNLYRRPLCRTMPMVYKGSNVTSFGVKVNEYTISDEAFAPVHDNDCVCKKDKCLPRGFSDMAPCNMGAPFTMSKPHYLDADPSSFYRLEGLRPDPEKHKTVVGIDPEMGLPLYMISSSQTNLWMGDVRYVSAAKPFANIMIPIVWINFEFQPIPSDIQTVLRWRFIYGPALFAAVEITILVAGLLMCGYQLFRYARPHPIMQYQIIPFSSDKEMQFVHENPLIDDVEL